MYYHYFFRYEHVYVCNMYVCMYVDYVNVSGKTFLSALCVSTPSFPKRTTLLPGLFRRLNSASVSRLGCERRRR